jgi:hemin uptake protein HemP
MRIVIVNSMNPPPSGPPEPSASPEPAAKAAPPTRRIQSDQLLRGGHEVVIEHHGREYRLRVTQNGKLILTA